MIITRQEFEGEILTKVKTLALLEEEKLNDVRGEEIGMIFQDPLSALNPLMRIGEQIEEGLVYHTKMSKQERTNRVIGIVKTSRNP